MDITTLNNTLSRIFAIIGHPTDQHDDLIFLFYTGLMGEVTENESITSLARELDALLNEQASDEPAEDLLFFWDLVKQYNLEAAVVKEFVNYLMKYVAHVKPSLEKEKCLELDEAINEANTLLQTRF